MFSRRFHWDARPNRLSAALEARRRAGREVLDLTESNPTRAGLEYPAEIAAALGDPRALVYEPAPRGLPAAREAVAAYYRARGIAVTGGRILLTASTSEAYTYLFKLLADPGDEVLVPRPSYPLFEYLAAMESLRAVSYPLEYHGAWSIDLAALEKALGPRTRAVVVVNPNNPTGSYLKRGELDRLIGLCAPRGVPLVSDEVFSDYALVVDAARVLSLAAEDRMLSFSMSGLSKVSGLPQMKLGWLVVNGPEDERAEAMERLEWIADTFLSVNTPVQCAAGRLLEAGENVYRQIAARTRANLDFLHGSLDARSSLSVLALEGGWYATLQVPRIRSEEEWTVGLLEECGVLAQPGFFYDFTREAFLVLSLLTAPEIFEEGVRRLTGYFGTR